MAAAVINNKNVSDFRVFPDSMMWKVVAPCTVIRRIHTFNESMVHMVCQNFAVPGTLRRSLGQDAR